MPEKFVNGINISYSTYGDKNNPPLFLSHGLTADRNHWTAIAERLADSYFVVTYDCRGHGKTDKPEAYTMHDMGKDLISLIDEFGFDSVYAAGCSMGGMITLTAATIAPEKFKKIMPIVTRCHVNGDLTADMFASYGVTDPSKVTPEEMMKIAWDAVWCPETPSENRVAEKFEPLTPEQYNAAQKAIGFFDLRPDLSNITCSALVISGKWDKLIPAKYGKELASLLPNAEFIEYEHSGHRLLGEETDRLVNQMRDFLCE